MATAQYSWNLVAYEQHGKLWIKWSTDAPFRAQQGQICVYDGVSFPSNPQDNRAAWNWDNNNTPWDTGQTWGKNWCCAYIAQASPNGPYAYSVQLTTTGATPESRRSE